MTKELNPVKLAIKNYLDERAKSDELFAQSYAKPNKNIDECFDYILGEAHKIGGTAVCVSDEVVFGWAVHYYDEDSIKISKLPNGTKATTKAQVELTEEDKEKAREQAVDEYKRQCIAAMKAEEAAKAKKAAEKKKALIEKRKQEESELPTLFSFD